MFIEVIYQEKTLTQALNSKMSESGIKIFNWLVDQMRSKPSIKDSIKNISIALGLSERTIQKWLSYFKNLGLITKEQLYGIYSHNTISLNRGIFMYARYFKYRFESLWRYLAFVYLRPTKKPCTPYIEEKDINISISQLPHPNLFINCDQWSSTGDSLWGIGYQEFVFHGNGEVDRSIPDDRQLENFTKILEELENKEIVMSKEDLFWDGLTKVLRLSEHGKIKLQVFPVRIVNAAYKKLQQQNRVHDKVKWLIRECDNLCKVDGIAPAWGKYYDALRSFGIQQTDPLTQEDQIELLDFAKPQVKEVEIYSTRDLTPYKQDIDTDTLNKGLLFLGDFLPVEVQENIKKYINDNSSL